VDRWADDDIRSLLGNVGSFQPGERIGQDYEVIELLGRGGQAEAYKVRNDKDGNTYVAKIFIGDEGNRSFEREQAVFRALKGTETNPHIVHAHPATGTGGQKILVLDYLDGPTLHDYLTQHGPSLGLARRVARQMLMALETVHARGVVHRDVKPSNIKLADGGTRVVLFDFSIAAEIGDGTAAEAGSPGYVPPEAGSDIPRDVFSLGVVLHKVATGRLPLWKVGGGRPTSAADALVIPPELARHPVLAYCLAKSLSVDPSRRFRSTGEFRKALARWQAPATTFLWLARSIAAVPGLLVLTGAGLLSALLIQGAVFYGRWIVPLGRDNLLLEQKADELDAAVGRLKAQLAAYVREIEKVRIAEFQKELDRYALNPKVQLEVCEHYDDAGGNEFKGLASQVAYERQRLEGLIRDVGRGKSKAVSICRVECRLKDRDRQPVELKLKITIRTPEGGSCRWIHLRKVATDCWVATHEPALSLGVWKGGARVTLKLREDPSASLRPNERDVFQEEEYEDMWSISRLQPREDNGEIVRTDYENRPVHLRIGGKFSPEAR